MKMSEMCELLRQALSTGDTEALFRRVGETGTEDMPWAVRELISADNDLYRCMSKLVDQGNTLCYLLYHFTERRNAMHSGVFISFSWRGCTTSSVAVRSLTGLEEAARFYMAASYLFDYAITKDASCILMDLSSVKNGITFTLDANIPFIRHPDSSNDISLCLVFNQIRRISGRLKTARAGEKKNHLRLTLSADLGLQQKDFSNPGKDPGSLSRN